MANIPRLRTPGVIAGELDVPLGRVLYVLRTRSHLIKPIGRAGCLRLYDRAAVEAVRDVLADMDRRQGVARAVQNGFRKRRDTSTSAAECEVRHVVG